MSNQYTVDTAGVIASAKELHQGGDTPRARQLLGFIFPGMPREEVDGVLGETLDVQHTVYGIEVTQQQT